MKLSQKQVVITGASRGIGYAFAKKTAQEKNHLILVVRKSSETIEKELLKLGALSVQWLIADLSLPEETFRVRCELEKLNIDVLFNNAGLLTGGQVEQQNFNEIEKMLAVNVHAVISLSQAVLPKMLKRNSGCIINHGSVSSIMHLPCASTYSAAKAAVWAFTDCLQQELYSTDVKALCLITPGIKTEMFDQIDVLYSKNMKVPKNFITADRYAERIFKAVEMKKTVLFPEGLTAIGLNLAIHARPVFNWLSRQTFKRI